MVVESVRKRAEDSVTVLFADGASVVVPLEVALRFGLRKGDDIPPETLESLQQSSHRYAVREAALSFLARRDHTAAELRGKLLKKKFLKDDINPVLDELVRKGFINDELFARKFVAHRLHQRKIGPVKIRQELARRGVARHIVEDMLRDAERAVVPSDELLPLAAKKAGQLRKRGAEGRVLAAKLFAYLAGRGYTPEQIKNVVKQLTGEAAAEE